MKERKYTKAFEGVRYSIFQWEQEQFDGSIKTFETIGRNDTVIIYAINGEKIILVEEEQPHWGKSGLGIPGGCVEKDEHPFDAARRELIEETGYVFEDFFLIQTGEYVPGFLWKHHIIVAKNLVNKVPQAPDVGEKITPQETDFDEFIKKVKAREFHYRPAFTDEFILRDKISELKELLSNPEKFAIQSKSFKNL